MWADVGKSTPSGWRSRLNCAKDLRRGHDGITPDIAFPDTNDSPTNRSQNTRHLPIPLAIPFDLRNPTWSIPAFSQLAWRQRIPTCPVRRFFSVSLQPSSHSTPKRGGVVGGERPLQWNFDGSLVGHEGCDVESPRCQTQKSSSLGKMPFISVR